MGENKLSKLNRIRPYELLKYFLKKVANIHMDFYKNVHLLVRKLKIYSEERRWSIPTFS